jgi:putative intracellular protease/amidase
MKNILMIVTSHTTLGDTGRSTGWYFGEAAHPWKVLTDLGHEVAFASPQGGQTSHYAYNADDPDQVAFLNAFGETGPITMRTDELTSSYDAVLFVGGHGTMWDFPEDIHASRLATHIYESGGIVAAVCHGPAALVNVKLTNGKYLVAERHLSAFTDQEEESIGLTNVVPFPLSTTLAARGALLDAAENFQPKVTVDDRLITGQNPASARGVGEAVAQALQQL